MTASAPSPRLAILIPAYNEESTVADVVRVALESKLGEVLVVSDGSRDRTAERARAAGARVLELGQNRGKGGAVAAGVAALEADLLMLLDSDLKHLAVHHLQALLEPVLSGKADTTAGLFRGGGASTDFGNRATPFLSGQRVIPRATLLAVPDLAERRYAIELAIGDRIKLEGLRLKYVQLEGVSQVMKERKRGFLGGFARRLRMYWQIASYALFGRRRAKGSR